MQSLPVRSGAMNGQESRYDEIADWYVEFTASWPSEPIAVLPDDLTGQHVLDMASGHGTAARYLASCGAVVTAVDISEKLLVHARSAASSEPAAVRYVAGDVTTTKWWDGHPFDGVLCNMALMDVDDLDGALSTVSAVLKPHGWFSASILHPCFPGSTDGSAVALSSWHPERGYSWEGRWNTSGTGVRGHADVNHRTVATYLNALINHGLALDRFAEPDSTTVPRYFVVLCHAAA
jgi:2-polyprenyl-3-methyl-5-hydroxy-6-metoxy-1,4-benzoquinol methylase